MPERAVVRRILALASLGLVAGLWLVARPAVVREWRMVALFEFPVGLAVVALLCWLAARPARAKERPEAPWRRHEQVVRPLADPEAAPLEGALDAWLERGEPVDAAADVLARALDPDPDRRAAHREELLAQMRGAGNRRKREAIARRVLDASLPQPSTIPLPPEGTGA